MISSFCSGLKREESGQAIILGAVSLLVLAVGIMTTVQLGWAVKERIQLQHAADNAAYSAAVVAARSLNFISWTNRAVIAQYVSAMAIQSFSNYVDVVTVLIAQVAASFLTAAFLVGTVAKILLATVFFAAVGAALEPIARVLGSVGDGIKVVVDALKSIAEVVDVAVGVLVYGVSLLNQAYYWGLQQTLGKGFVLENLGASMLSGRTFYSESLEKTAGWSSGGGVNSGTVNLGNLVSGGLSLAEYKGLFNKNSENMSSGNQDEVRKAKFLMVELVNASREGKKNIKWETSREAGPVQVLNALLNAITGGDGNSLSFLKAIFPSSIGGGLVANKIELDAVGGDGGEFGNVKNIAKKNPVFNQNVYYSGTGKQPQGDALITADFIFGVGGDNVPGFISTALKWLSVAGELFPIEKMIGIQAAKGANESLHCKYDDISAVRSGNSTSGVCDGLCDEGKEGCESSCREYCPEYKVGSDGETTDECAVATVWEPQSESPTEEEKEQCSSCSKTMNGSDKSCEQQIESCKQALNAAEDAAMTAVNEGIQGLTGGFPAKVSISCDSERSRHKFSGITPYLSFDIASFEKDQVNGRETYPSVFSAAQKKPIFMKLGALGFGSNFGNGSKFKMSSIGVVKGVGTGEIGGCEEGFSHENGCVQDGYSFNYLEEDGFGLGGVGMITISRAQIYYHRPETWAEPPNLFNPYWKAKLSPVSPYFTSSVESLGRDFGAIGELVANGLETVVDTILSH